MNLPDLAVLLSLFVVVETIIHGAIKKIETLREFPEGNKERGLTQIKPLNVKFEAPPLYIKGSKATVTFSGLYVDDLSAFTIDTEESVNGKLVLKFKSLKITVGCRVNRKLIFSFGEFVIDTTDSRLEFGASELDGNGKIDLTEVSILINDDTSSMWFHKLNKNVFKKSLNKLSYWVGSDYLRDDDAFLKPLFEYIMPNVLTKLLNILNENLQKLQSESSTR